MKSRQRLEQRKHRFSEDSPPVVSKPQDSISNSTAPLQETLKLEIVGQTPTKGKYYKDNKSAVQARDAKRMWVNGQEVKKTHPLYKAGRYKGFEDAAFSSLENYKDSAEGEVYIITNKAWPEWVKVGMAVDSQDRLKNYQTSSPFRDYVLLYAYEVNDRRAGESAAHARLAKECDNINEWFRIPHAVANELILEVIHEH